MKKIIVRNTPSTDLASKLILFDDKHWNTKDEFISFYGLDKVLRDIFGEKDGFNILNKKYNECLKAGSNNDDFFYALLIDKEYGIMISEKSHIYLLHLEPHININGSPILDWNYYNDKKYIGDAWWSNDKEIVDDISKLTMIEFFKKYKGF